MDKEVDYLLPFHCLPPSNEDEWANLKGFVDTYNALYKTRYKLESFPENSNRSTPEPEVLLRDDSCKMVVERKIIPIPLEHVRTHQLWHELINRISDGVSERFFDDLYRFSIKETNIPTNKKAVIDLANSIVSALLKYELELKDPGDFFGFISEDGSEGDVPWTFEIMPDLDREDSPIDFGISFSCKKPWIIDRKQYLSDGLLKIESLLLKFFQSTVKKFEKYEECHRVLLLEPYTDILSGFRIALLIEAVQRIEVPTDIDQVWLKVQIEASDNELLFDYILIADMKQDILSYTANDLEMN